MANEPRGISIPFRIDPATGGITWQQDASDKIKENLIHILMTSVGERLRRRKYGGGLRSLVHEPSSEALRAIVQHQIARSIGLWEPRVLLQSVSVFERSGTLFAELHYIERREQQTQSLSVPLGIGGA